MNDENKTYLIRDAEAEELTLQEQRPSASKVLYEDTEKRDRYSKHFRLENGNFMAVMYEHPVHEPDPKTGKYMEIVRELKENETDYEAKMDRFKARFPKEEGEFITVEKEEKAVSWRFVPKQQSRGRKSMATFRKKEKKEAWDLEEVPSVRYEKADGDTDFQYDISEDGVKESIVLTTCPQAKEFVFEMKLQELKAELSEDKKEVFLRSEDGSEEMRIPPAFMVDEKGAYSDDIHYELEEKKGGLFLKLVLDTDWIEAPERQFPVVIDPRIEVTAYGTSRLAMAEVCSIGSGVSAPSVAKTRRVGVDEKGGIHRIYVEVKPVELPEGSRIMKAGLLLHQLKREVDTGMDSYEVYAVDTGNYSVNSASFVWNNVKNFPIVEFADSFRALGLISEKPYDIDLTQVLKRWHRTQNETFCIMIKRACEECPSNSIYTQFYADFYSPYDDTYKPMLYVEYSSEDMYADHQEYHTFENGRAGKGSVNLFHGNFMFAHNDITMKSPKLPFSISHLYRPTFTGTTYGVGWKLSVEQKVMVVKETDIYAIYIDAQGKYHYFQQGDDDLITDDGGLGLEFKESYVCDSGEFYYYMILDRQGNHMEFDEDGRLIKLVYANGNSTCLSYTNGNLTGVFEGENQLYSLSYENNKLKQISGCGDILNFEYSGDYLTSIVYPSKEGDTRKTEFAYSNRTMSTVKDYSGISHSISYDVYGRVSKITNSGTIKVSEAGVQTVQTVVGDEILIEYRGNSTAVQDARTKVKHVYRFDENGRVLVKYQDLLEVLDSTQKSFTTLAELKNYESIQKVNMQSATGKYTSMTAALNSDIEDEDNLLVNANFLDGTSMLYPPSWSVVGIEDTSSGISTESYLSGIKSYHFESEKAYESQSLWQRVEFNRVCQPGDVLVASAWAKVSEDMMKYPACKPDSFQVSLRVELQDGSQIPLSVIYDSKYFGWQYVAVPFAYTGGSMPVAATMSLNFGNNKGDCYFTNPQLVWSKGEVTSNTYATVLPVVTTINVLDVEQDIVQITERKNSNYTITSYQNTSWDEVRRVIRDKDGHEFMTDMQYDYKHNLTKTKDYRGIVTLMTYNEFGKVTKKQTYHESQPTKQFLEKYGYNDEQFLISELDPRYSYDGSLLEREYTYDVSRGLLESETDLNGQIYQHTYDDVTDEKLSFKSIADGMTQENLIDYQKGSLTKLSHNNICYGFAFDALGRSEAVSIGGSTLFTTAYEEFNTYDTVKRYYATGEETEITNDIFGNPIKFTYKGKNSTSTKELFTATYDHAGKVKKEVDNESLICHNYTYNKDGQLVTIGVSDTRGNLLRTSTFSYDDKKRLEKTEYGATGHTYYPVYEGEGEDVQYPDAETVGIRLDGKYTDLTEKDPLGRLNKRTLTVGGSTLSTQNYGYLKTILSAGNTIETGIVSGITGQFGNQSTGESYTYDINGNIETVTVDSELVAKYTYDSLNRLVREDNYVFGKSYTYKYDQGGNIKQRIGCCFCQGEPSNEVCGTDTFQYKGSGWKDQLISYNGKECKYDELGNLTQFGDKQLTWTKVRKLASFGNVTFTYDARGMRTGKSANGVTHSYIYEEDLLVKETFGNNTITYYQGTGGVIGFNYNGTDYFYRRNLQGDVVAIYTAQGTLVAKYVYDAWGNHKVYSGNNIPVTDTTHIGYINPIRYRGYYYDVETRWFWLSSRYYSPELCRFISPDSVDYLDPSSINGLNLYAYCNNDPINYADPSGHVAISIGLLLAIGGIVGAAIGAGASVAGQYLANGCSWENFSWGQLALDTVLGGVSGMLSMSPLGCGTMIAANAGIGFVGAVGGHLINGSDFSKLSTWVDIGLSTGLGALVGVVGGPGALNAGYLNGAKQTAGFIRAAGLYDDVLTKAVTGFYRTPGIASNALRLSGQNLVKQWNKMVVSQAGKALTKALAYGGTALLIGTAGKGWLYDWYSNYF